MLTKLRLVFTITIAFLSFYGKAQTSYWQTAQLKGEAKAFSQKVLKVDQGSAFKLDELQFKKSIERKGSSVVYFPNEQGESVGYRVTEVNLFSPELAKKYPGITSYHGVGINDEKKQIRFSVSHKGIQSMVQETGGNDALFMQKTKKDTYVLYRRSKQSKSDFDFVCNTVSNTETLPQNLSAKIVDDQQLRIFRVAISASGEYTQFHGGTKADALAAINATLTRINGIFENDLGVRLELIGNTDEVIYVDPTTDPYTGSLSSQAQSTFTSVIGAENYDIGHLFNQEDDALDGNAGFIGAVCRNNLKGSGYTTLGSPIGDSFDIDLVAHEIGHQFGANHSFSHVSEGTLVQVEPASGTTIMAYAGITGINNVAQNSDDYFHYVSIKQIRDYLETVSCGQVINLTNTPPSLTLLQDHIIPKGTAFSLTASATDADGDLLTYTWEQIDNGTVTQATFGPNNPAGANFRSLPPSISPVRYFPKLDRVLNGNLTQSTPSSGADWETISNIGRQLNFAVTVRDNAVGGAQLVSDEVNVSVLNNAGPFLITSQSTPVSYVAGTVQTITWNVANTDVAPITESNVDILLSTDGGLTFSTILLENTPNDGSQQIIIPSIETTIGRIMVKPANAIFFALNTADISITPTEVILDFDQVTFEVCKPDDLSVDFNYETYLGFNEESTFSIASLPDGLNAVFTPLTATDTNTPVTLDFTGINDLEEGVYPIQVLASSASLTKDITLELRVFDSNFEPVLLTAPVDGFQDAPTNLLLEWEDDIGNSSYDIEIATDFNFTNIIETANVLDNSYLPTELDNDGDYFWRVKPKNNCGEGVFSPVFNFSTIQFNCKTIEATGLPLVITSSGTPVVSSKITFFEDLPVADINVSIDLEHTFIADLVISLTSPAGTTVTLVSSSCGEFDDIVATFDDDASPFICGSNTAISGMVRPLGDLSSFNGESSLGEWTLEVRDNVTADGGRLNAFSLDICVEGDFRPDADNDGVFDDGDDLCLDTPLGDEVDINGCTINRFSNQNFTIRIESETCAENNDGAVNIIAQLALDYEINVTGNGLNLTEDFTNSYLISNLASGTYTICINATDGTVSYETYCLDVEITEPDPLFVTSAISFDDSQITLQLEGANLYNVELNGIVTQTSEDRLVLNLQKGFNAIRVFTNIACQGVYEEQVGIYENPIVFPNPIMDRAEVFIGASDEEVLVQIFSVDGSFVKEELSTSENGKIIIDFSSFSTGLYFLKFSGATVNGTTKVIKK